MIMAGSFAVGRIPNPGPMTQIQPFTYEDGLTFAEILYALKRYIQKTLLPYLGEVTTELDTKIAKLISDVDAALDAQTAENAELNQQLREYVDEQVALIINDSIQVQDPVMAGIMGDEESDTRVVVDTLYAEKAIEPRVDDLDDLTENGRLSAITTTNTFGRGVSLAKHGAIGDGVANDTAAILAAIAEASADGGGQVYMPPGTYLTDPFTVPANIAFLGDHAAGFKIRNAAGVFITVAGNRVTFNGVKVDGDNKVTSWLIDFARNVTDFTWVNSEACNVSGPTTLALFRLRAGNKNFNITDSHFHHATSVTIGRHILIGDSEGTVENINISRNRFNDVYPVADGDSIVIQDFTLRVDVSVDGNTFRDCAKRAIKIQAAGVRVTNNDIEIGTIATRAYCAIAVYASDAIVKNNATRGHYSTAFIEVGAGSQMLNNVTIDADVYADAANRGPSCDGIISLGEGLANSTIVARIANVRHGVRLENILKNISVSLIASELTGSAIIFDDNETAGSTVRQAKNLIVPFLVLDAITNYAIHTNGGNAPANLVVGSVSGIANFGKFGGNIAAGVRLAFFEKNSIAKPTVTGVIEPGTATNSVIVRGAELGLWVDGRTPA